MSGPTKGDSGIAHFTTSNLIVQKPHDFMESQNQATELANSLNRFWDIESAGITETSRKVNEDEQFLRFIKFDKDEGRYEVDLVWREQTCKQSDNFDLSVTRLNCLKARLKKLLQEYDNIFKAQLEAGIIELVSKDEEDFKGAHFLPHHGVLREDSLRSRRLEVVGTRKNGRARRRHAKGEGAPARKAPENRFPLPLQLPGSRCAVICQKF